MTVSLSIIQRALKSGNPVIHGDRAIFIWQGRTAPYLTSDLNYWDENPKRFKRVSPRLIPASTKPIWSCTLTVPRDAYVEYAFQDLVTRENFPDPLNRKSVPNGIGGRNNFFYMPETMPSPFAFRRADVTPGKLTRHRVDTKWLREGYEREIFLYRPPVKEPVPLLVVYDGQDYLHRGKLAVIADNLIAEGRIQPIAMAFLPSGGRWRDVEYSCSDGTILWLDQTVLPLAQEKLNLLDVKKQPGAYGVLGASLGGTMAMYTGLRMPDVFGRVLSQSGAFNIESRDFVVVDLVRHGQARGLDIWMDIGRLDILLEDNRWMHALLQEKGYNVSYREFSAGHNYTAWRDDVRRGLEAMFPI
jgi:enterochelin esterase-like enzyme